MTRVKSMKGRVMTEDEYLQLKRILMREIHALACKVRFYHYNHPTPNSKKRRAKVGGFYNPETKTIEINSYLSRKKYHRKINVLAHEYYHALIHQKKLMPELLEKKTSRLQDNIEKPEKWDFIPDIFYSWKEELLCNHFAHHFLRAHGYRGYPTEFYPYKDTLAYSIHKSMARINKKRYLELCKEFNVKSIYYFKETSYAELKEKALKILKQ